MPMHKDDGKKDYFLVASAFYHHCSFVFLFLLFQLVCVGFFSLIIRIQVYVIKVYKSV
ncbi:hypothetical protein Syun_019009 [Stephania yunnanensis]|uniref:Uncharacterized protein n=1 Tax=Stephania yunnanensis TaxID=152371 RepID=A0AAP0ITA5_9MAGN